MATSVSTSLTPLLTTADAEALRLWCGGNLGGQRGVRHKEGAPPLTPHTAIAPRRRILTIGGCSPLEEMPCSYRCEEGSRASLLWPLTCAPRETLTSPCATAAPSSRGSGRRCEGGGLALFVLRAFRCF